MIKATEFRIGNIVGVFLNSGKSFGKVKEISAWSVELSGSTGFDSSVSGNFEVEKLDPVPLTPEILEKCGFEYIHVNNHFWQQRDCPQIELHPMAEATKEANGPYLYLAEGMPVAHLHQLQNLFFALTGEELNVKL